MKKKFGIIIACVMLVSLILGVSASADVKDLYNKIETLTTVIDLSSLTENDLSSAPIKGDKEATGIADDSAAESKMIKFDSLAGATASTYLTFGDPKDASGADGFIFRFKTDIAINWHGITFDADSVQFHPANVKFIALDGTVTDSPYHYSHQLPAGFDGYVMVSFDTVIFPGEIDGTREGNLIKGSETTDQGKPASYSFDLSKLTKMAIVPYAQTASEAVGTSFYLGNAYFYTLKEEAAPSPSQGAEPSPSTGSSTGNPSTGAPLLIVTGISALVSCAYVIKSKKHS